MFKAILRGARERLDGVSRGSHDGIWHEVRRVQQKAAQKTGREFRRVAEGVEVFMRKKHDADSCKAVERQRHDAESCKAAERYSKAAAVLPTVDTNTRRLGMERGSGRGGGRRAAQETEVWV